MEIESEMSQEFIIDKSVHRVRAHGQYAWSRCLPSDCKPVIWTHVLEQDLYPFGRERCQLSQVYSET